MSRGARFVLLCGATLFQFVALGIYLSALPLFVTRELGASRAAVGVGIGAFSLTAVVLRPFVGRGIDRRGRRLFLVAAPAILVVTSIAFTAAESVGAVVVIRLVQGVAGACFYTAAATVATDLAPEAQRADYLARFSLFLYGGLAIGPAVGEFLVEHNGYRWTWLAAGASAVLSLAVALGLPETGRPRPAGAAAPPSRTARARFLHPAALAPGLVILTAAVGYTSITGFSALYARSIGMSSSGPLYTTFAVVVLAVRLVAGRLADRRGRIAVALPGMGLCVVGMALLALQPPPALAFVGIAGFGAGFSLLFPALMALTVDRVDDAERGAAVGSFTAFFDIGSTTGSYAVGAVSDRYGFGGGYGLPAVLCLVGLGVLTRLGRQVRAESEAMPPPGPNGMVDETPLPEPPGA